MNRPLRILLVEDEAFIAMCMELELQQAGYDISKGVATGEEAITLIEEDSPDVILMDIRLAGEIDGIEAAQQIRAAHNIPIIFMTGYPDKEIEKRAKTLNPIGYFIKPVRIYDLKPIIDSIRS